MFRAIIAAAVLALPGAPCLADELPAVQDVLARFVEAVGGAQALEAVSERHYSGTIVQDLSWDDPRYSVKPFLAAADARGVVRYAEVADWSALLEHLRPFRRAVALDWRGHGRSGLPAEEDFSLPTLAAEVAAAIDRLGLDRFALVGHSAGGVIALAYASRYPDRVAHRGLQHLLAKKNSGKNK